MPASAHPWLDKFIGRELDLATLLKDFEAVSDLNQPRFVALVAESGVGKTRLVQQIYHSLRKTNDPSGYWPAAFPGDHVSLHLRPDFSTHSNVNTEGPGAIPYLWWAVRFPQPTQRNDLSTMSCGLLASADSLLPHLEYVKAKQLQSADRAQAIDLCMDVIIEFAPTILEQALPGLGLGKSVLHKMRENKRLRNEKAKIQATIAAKGAFHEQQSAEIESRLLTGLNSCVASSPANGTSRNLPVVLVLDDLHWVDPRSVKLLARMFICAMENRWPLLVLATVWPQPWDDAARNVGSPLGQFRTALAHANLPVTQRRLERLSATAIVDQALPGLTKSQRKLLLERMGGDLYTLHIWMEDVRGRDRLFVNRDNHAALTPAGERSLLDLRHPREEVVRARFNSFDARIREVLGWASCQGYSFINRLVSSVDQRLRRDVESVGDEMPPVDALKHAEESLHFIEQASRAISRFSDSANYAVVARDLADAPDEASMVRHATLSEIESWIDDGRVHDFTWEELAQFLDISHHVLSQSQPSPLEVGSLALKVSMLSDLLSSQSLPADRQHSGVDLDELLIRFESVSTLPLLFRARWVAVLAGRRFSFQSDDRGTVERLRSIAFSLADEALANVLAGGGVQAVDALYLSANNGISLTYALFNIHNLWPARPSTPQGEEVDDAFIEEVLALEHRLRAETMPRVNAMLERVQHFDSPVGRLATIVMDFALTHMAKAGTDEYYDSQHAMATRLIALPDTEIRDEPSLALLFDGPLAQALFEWRYSTEQLVDDCHAVAARFRTALECGDIGSIGTYHLTVLACATNVAAKQAVGLQAASLLDRSYILSLELVRRGLARTVIDWMSIQDHVFAAMGVRLGTTAPADYLERGWQSVQRTISDLFDTDATLTELEIQKLASACLSAICRYVQHEGGPGAAAGFIDRAVSAIDSRVPHALDLARHSWAMRAINQRDADQAIQFAWYVSAYRAISRVTPKYMSLISDWERDLKICEQVEQAIRSPRDQAILFGAALDEMLGMWPEEGSIRARDLLPTGNRAIMSVVIIAGAKVDLSEFPRAIATFAAWYQQFEQVISDRDSLVPEQIKSFITTTRQLRAMLPSPY